MFPVEFQRSKNFCKDGFQTRGPPLSHKFRPSPEQVLGKAGKGNCDLRTYSPFNLLFQTKQT